MKRAALFLLAAPFAASSLLVAPFYALDSAKLQAHVSSLNNGTEEAHLQVFAIEGLDVEGVPATPLDFARAAFSSPEASLSREALLDPTHFSREALLAGWDEPTVVDAALRHGAEALVLFSTVPTLLSFAEHRHDDDGKHRFHRYNNRNEAMRDAKKRIRDKGEGEGSIKETSVLPDGSFLEQSSSSLSNNNNNASLLVIVEPKALADYVSAASDGAPWHQQIAALGMIEELVRFAREHGIGRLALLYREAEAASEKASASSQPKLAIISLNSNNSVVSAAGVNETRGRGSEAVPADCLSSMLLDLACGHSVPDRCSAIASQHFTMLRAPQSLWLRMASGDDEKRNQPLDLDAAMKEFLEKREEEEPRLTSFRDELLQPLQPYHTSLLDIASGLTFGGLDSFPVERIDALRKDDGVDTEGEASSSISQQMARWLHWRASDNAFFKPETRTVKEKFIAAIRARKAAEAKAMQEADEALKQAEAMSEGKVKAMMKAKGHTAEP